MRSKCEVIAIVAEPSLYTCFSEQEIDFRRFGRYLVTLLRLFEVNQSARLVITDDLISSSRSRLAPKLHGLLLSKGVRADAPASPAIRLLLTLFDQFSINPKLEYTGEEDTTIFAPPFVFNSIVYRDENIQLAWTDLLAQVGIRSVGKWPHCREILSAHEQDSCFAKNQSYVKLIEVHPD
jgi:hypothetical protein